MLGLAIVHCTSSSEQDGSVKNSDAGDMIDAGKDDSGNITGDASANPPDASVDATPGDPTLDQPVDTLLNATPPNTWIELPDSKMEDECPTTVSGVKKGYACNALMTAWNGAVWDHKRERLVVYGGGHNDSAINTVFAFDLGRMKWSRLTNVRADIAVEDGVPSQGTPSYIRNVFYEPCGYYPKSDLPIRNEWRRPNDLDRISESGCEAPEVKASLDFNEPRSLHSYGNMVYDPVQDALCLTGMIAMFQSATTSSPEVACYSLEKGKWERKGKNPFIQYNRAAVDGQGNIWYHGQYALARYDRSTQTFVKVGEDTIYSLTADAAEIDTKRNQFVMYKHESNEVLREALTTAPQLAVERTPGPSERLKASPGLVYVPSLDKFFVWDSGKDFQVFDPASRAWSVIAGNGKDPGEQQKNGTFGRLRYSAKRHALVLANSVNKNVFVFKLQK
jgi:hypothetical protein